MAHAILRTQLDSGIKDLIRQDQDETAIRVFEDEDYDFAVVAVSKLNEVFEGLRTYQLVEYVDETTETETKES